MLALDATRFCERRDTKNSTIRQVGGSPNISKTLSTLSPRCNGNFCIKVTREMYDFV